MKEQQTATNDICLMHDTSEKYVVNGMHGGRVLVHDRESGKILSDFIPHEYDIWYVHLTQDQNYLYTCGDDQKHIKHDLRMKLDLDQSSAPLNAVYTCKKHDAGVTWILKESAFDQSLDSSHYVMTGSYDGKIKLWDERNMRGGEVRVWILEENLYGISSSIVMITTFNLESTQVMSLFVMLLNLYPIVT
eukprot:403343090